MRSAFRMFAAGCVLVLCEGAHVHGQALLRMPCLDASNMQAKFLDGEVEEVYSQWTNFFRTAGQTGATVDRDCHMKGNKMLGALHLLLRDHRDTAAAEINFYWVLKLAPREELWELWLPMEPQTFWDRYREENGRARTDMEIWKDHWLPPVSYMPAKDSSVISLRRIYHRNRLLYANAGEDGEVYFKIINETRTISDPSFILLRADAMLRLGVSPSQTGRELDKFTTPSGDVVSQGDLMSWRSRLGIMNKERSATLEKKEVLQPPQERRVQLKIRNGEAKR